MVVDVDEAAEIIRKYRELNSVSIFEIQFVRQGIPVEVPEDALDEFSFTGLGNTNFIQQHFMGEHVWTSVTFVNDDDDEFEDPF